MEKSSSVSLKNTSKPVSIPGVILAGGQSTRMGGKDKGLIKLGEYTLLEYVISRLKPQVSTVVLNANGDTSRFSRFELPVLPDPIQGFLGPLAGVLAGLEWAETNGYDKIVTVAADTPFFPKTLVRRLNEELTKKKAHVALACTIETSGSRLIRHPTFGLWSVFLKKNLEKAILAGTRKVVVWTEAQKTIEVVFEETNSETFFNINTHDDLLATEDKLSRILV